MNDSKLILVTGATGYIASRLIPRLLSAGYRVRCMARQPERLSHREWASRVEIVASDVMDVKSLSMAIHGVNVIYYLVHNMAAGNGYERIDLESARNLASAAYQEGVEHIIYLGGLADPSDPHLAPHLRSRIETGEVLRKASIPVTEFRAGIIVGPGSVSFEMIRFVAEQFPLMIGPNWLRHRTQPIAISNVLDYLMAALLLPDKQSRVIEIGGREIMTYAEAMCRYGTYRGLHRSMLLVPFIPSWFMAFFINKLTPIEYSYARALVEGLKNDSLILGQAHQALFPEVELLDYSDAVRASLDDLRPDTLERLWLDSSEASVQIKHEGFLVDYRLAKVKATAKEAFQKICDMGGRRGWPAWNPLWQLRGWVDRLIGGPGMRGRPEILQKDVFLDFYRVEVLDKGFLRLRSELKAPGLGWMEWEVSPTKDGCILEQTAFFAPKGLPGFLYWHLLNPFHRLVFDRLVDALIRQSEGRK